MGRFSFTGKVKWNKDGKKFPSFRPGKTKGGDDYLSMTLFVQAAENNSATVEMFGKVQKIIKTKADDADIEVKWEDRYDPKTLESVAWFRKNTIQLGEDRDDRVEFLSSYDAIRYIRENIGELDGKMFTFTGRVKKNEYNGNVNDRFDIQNIYKASEDRSPSFNISDEIFFNKDSFDFGSFTDEKKIFINAYTLEYMGEDDPSVYVPKTYVIDCHRLDLQNEDHLKIFNARWMPINLKLEKGKPAIGIKKGKYYSMAVRSHYFRGAKEAEFDESQLTDLQKAQIELGVKTLDDFRPKGRIYGSRMEEYKLYDCDISQDKYKDGVAETDETASEFEEKIYKVGGADVADEPSQKTDSASDEFNPEDLFG